MIEHKKLGKKKENEVAKTVIKSHAFLLDHFKCKCLIISFANNVCCAIDQFMLLKVCLKLLNIYKPESQNFLDPGLTKP